MASNLPPNIPPSNVQSIERSDLSIARQLLPKVANPAPLGLAGFGLTTVVLSLVNANIIPPEVAGTVVVPLAFAYGGLAQIIAGILEFRTGNTFGVVAFTSYGLFWWWYALLLWTVGGGILKPPSAVGLGVTLLMWGIFTTYMWIATFRSNKGVWGVFLLLAITFYLLAAGDGLGSAGAKVLGGWFGIVTGALALYVSFAEVTNGAFGRTVIPLGDPIAKEQVRTTEVVERERIPRAG